ncbi:MAG TPA: branched-chain amino acid ABC transporter permease [Anaerolineaceae bacterium]|nr:branched-chain amino acid ABC transporter permease [Anaerolineaceae bacterium]HPN53221.1 branched-chain amino acid ABC transporter permease [Anaerolineaceae bacterium]
MRRLSFLHEHSAMLSVLGILLVMGIFGWALMGQMPFVRTALSGLTLGALYFMVAAGLTLIFGLMDVLNFAHGAMFMLGAYMGWQFYTNPTFLFGLFPLIFALLTGLTCGPLVGYLLRDYTAEDRTQQTVQSGLGLAGVLVGFLALNGLDIIGMADTAMVDMMNSANPLAEITPQEPLGIFWFRPLLMVAAGALIAGAASRPGDKTRMVSQADARRAGLGLGALLALTAAATLVRESGPVAVLTADANLRFFGALLVGAVCGAGFGAAVEVALIRPLYARPIYQVIVTLGLAYVLKETIQLLWEPLAYQMSRPPLFAQPGKAANIFEWFVTHNQTVDVFGVTFPSYRLFIIAIGILMLIALGVLMKYSRFGMIIRAGVQDRQMVEALGINVRQVFTFVFVMGIALAALGGIGASPFIPVQPNMGDAFQLQAFIVVVIGGMGSYSGAAIGALLLGLARAFGDYLALKYNLSPAIAEASTVIIMAIVLLVRPAGLFGRKE